MERGKHSDDIGLYSMEKEEAEHRFIWHIGLPLETTKARIKDAKRPQKRERTYASWLSSLLGSL